MSRLVIAAGLATIAVSANAGLVIDTLSATYPGTENVLFNDLTLISMGPLVQGMTNDSKFIVDWYGAGEDLLTENAQVKAVDGSFSMFSVTMNEPGLGIAAYQFNLDALGTGDVTINLYENGSLSYTEMFGVKESGPNTFRVYGTEKEVMSAVSIISQVELSGVSRNRIYALPGSVPEPGAFIALGVGLAGLLVRKRLQ